MALFTAENAAEMGKKGIQARRKREAQREIEAQQAAITPLKPLELILDIDLKRVRERLDTLDSLMAKAQTDREWDNLSRAYERMFKVWCILTRTPLPGSLKPVSDRPRRTTSGGPTPIDSVPPSGQ